ncbi:noncompact myelin-associated protein [Elgaria multicarinata webbii]|uniref:noncompact myelin-associated protein n=1 Tax=Elgaria multicarinata webbii TaxID=159646 RepID=UPI002FCD0FAB
MDGPPPRPRRPGSPMSQLRRHRPREGERGNRTLHVLEGTLRVGRGSGRLRKHRRSWRGEARPLDCSWRAASGRRCGCPAGGAPGRAGEAPRRPVSPRAAGTKMTTVAPATEISLPSTNVTPKSQEMLYQSSGAIVAAIVVGVIVIFTAVLLLLKMYNRRMRAQRELEPKNAKATIPSSLGQSSNDAGRNTAVTFVPVDIHMPQRRP